MATRQKTDKTKAKTKAKAKPAKKAAAKKVTAKRGPRKLKEPGTLSRQALWQRKQRELGLCVLCSEPAFKGWRCVKHYEKHKTLMRERYQPTVRGRYKLRSEEERAEAKASKKTVKTKKTATKAKPAKVKATKVNAKAAKPKATKAKARKVETPEAASA